MRKVIGVDVDLTVVDTLHPWIGWYYKLTGHNVEEEMKSYEYGIEELMHNHNDPMAFWKKSDLYDDLQPIVGSKEALFHLSKHFDIVFVSASFPEHTMSKEFFLKRHFPFMKGFVSTRQKGFVKCDYFIDDYTKYLNQVKEGNPDCVTYHFATELNKNKTSCTWRSIFEDIMTREGL